MQRDNVSTSLHQSYEVTFRVLNENPTSLIDYRHDNVSHSFQYVFSNYRELYETLEELNIVLTVKFPPTHVKSSMGLSLSETELQQRCAQLSEWFDCLMDNYTELSAPAQNAVLIFCRLDTLLEQGKKQGISNLKSNRMLFEAVAEAGSHVARDKRIVNIEKILELIKIPGSIYHPVALSINLGIGLKKKSLSTQQLDQAAEEVTGEGGRGGPSTLAVNVVSGVAATDAKKSDIESPEKGSSSPNKNDGTKLGSSRGTVLGVDRKVSSKGSIIGSDDVSVKFKGEVIRDNLCILVERGLDMTKKTANNSEEEDKIRIVEEKKHTSYLTTISIINSEISFKQAFKQATFDSYRNLNQDLANFGVSNDRNAKYLIKANFPPTYKKSSLGIALNAQEIQDRASGLQIWLCALFDTYADLPEEAKIHVQNFFELHDDNPSEPQFRAILEILHPDWTSNDKEIKRTARNRVLLKPENRPSSSRVGSVASVGRQGGQGGQPPVKEIGEEMEGPPIGCGISCSIM